MVIGMKRELESPTNHLLGANMRVYLKMIRKQRFIYTQLIGLNGGTLGMVILIINPIYTL